MAGVFKREDAAEIIEQINYPALIKHYTTKNIGLSKLSQNIGEDEGHIWKKLKRKTIDIALLYTLSPIHRLSAF